MSTVKVNELSTYSGTDISVETGKTISGTASQFKMTDVVQGDVLYGSAADTLSRLAAGTSGQYLQTAGAGANPVWAAVAGHTPIASQWRLNTDVASGGQDPIDANLEVADQDGYGSLGAAMTESSGVFTFPATGYWLVIYNWTFQPSNYSNDCSCWIDATIDNGSNWVEQARTYESGAGAYENPKRSASATAIIDVTDVANVKVQFGWSINLNGGTRVTYGDSTKQETGFTFVRLGDT